MSKEGNTTKINISRELIKKQIVECLVLALMLTLIFIIVNVFDISGYTLGAFLGVIFLALFLVYEINRNLIKRKLDKLIIQSNEKTIQDIDSFYVKNGYQKENNSASLAKIRDMQNLVQNLQKYSDEMNVLTDETKQKTDKSLSFTNNEYSAVKTNIEQMFSIRHKIQTIAELILELSDFVQSISSTIGLVEDIAEQTNLLALNAAVEAARAGEHGKGFAVVASEIRKLADESKQATTKIISLINDIQQTANSTVLATEEGTKEIESGLEHANIISENIEQLINLMNEISGNVNRIINSSKQINEDSKITDNYIKEISTITKETGELTKENETIIEEISTTSNNLKKSIV